MPVVQLGENENPEYAIRRFKRLCMRVGVIQEIRRRSSFEKPTVARKRRRTTAIKREYRRTALARNRILRGL